MYAILLPLLLLPFAPDSGPSQSDRAVTPPTLVYEVSAPVGKLTGMGAITLSAGPTSVHAANRLIEGWIHEGSTEATLLWRYPPVSTRLPRSSITGVFRRLLLDDGIAPPSGPPVVTRGGQRTIKAPGGPVDAYLFTFESGLRIEVLMSSQLPPSPILRDVMEQMAGAISAPAGSAIARLEGTPVRIVLHSPTRGEIRLLSLVSLSSSAPPPLRRVALRMPFGGLLARILN